MLHFPGDKTPNNLSGRASSNLLLALTAILMAGGALSVFRPVWAQSNAEVKTGYTEDLGHLGTYSQGRLVEITFEGPASDGLGRETNPFLLRVDVTFTDPDGAQFVVPAFFDGDGQGGMKGNLWNVRFRPQRPGRWRLTTSSTDAGLDAQAGTFDVSSRSVSPEHPETGNGAFDGLGILKYADSHYLKFSDGDYWIKGGIDDPENFLGNAIGDWNAKKAAIDYLSSKGINSVYIVTNNIDGEENDTWPWFGATAEEAKANSDRFNLEKLQEWEDMFTYIQEHGLALHIVLNDDSAWNDYDHELYFREMVARFGHHPALIWNIAEEADEIYSDAEQSELAGLLKSLDPYDHPVTVHRVPRWPFLGDPNFDLTSLQAGPGTKDIDDADLSGLHRTVTIHRLESESGGRPIPVMVDELQRIAHVNTAIQRKVRTQVLYPVFFGGGNFELHFFGAYGQGGSVTFEDLAPILDDMYRVRRFMEGLPFNFMEPCQQILSSQDAYCFGQAGVVYALYLPSGGTIQVDLSGASGTFEVRWFNPRSGETSESGTVQGGAQLTFTAPDREDWVLRLHNPNGSPPGGGIFHYLPFVSGRKG